MTKTPQKPEVLTADVVEAGMFVLVDEQGKRRAKLSCMSDEHCKDGYVTAQLLDGAGKPRITLQVNDEGGKYPTLESFQFSLCNVERRG